MKIVNEAMLRCAAEIARLYGNFIETDRITINMEDDKEYDNFMVGYDYYREHDYEEHLVIEKVKYIRPVFEGEERNTAKIEIDANCGNPRLTVIHPNGMVSFSLTYDREDDMFFEASVSGKQGFELAMQAKQRIDKLVMALRILNDSM